MEVGTGRWGVNYIYGTFWRCAACALRAARASRPIAQRAAHWIRPVQNPDGGWGESCQSYRTKRFVAAPSTPSQTAWAILGLLAAATEARRPDARAEAFDRNAARRRRGTKSSPLAPDSRTSSICATIYRNYFPLLALTQGQGALVATGRTVSCPVG